MNRSREEFKEPLWNDFNFVYEALDYFKYIDGFWILDGFISEIWYDNMLIVCTIIKKLRAAHNHIGLRSLLKRIPRHAWFDKSSMILHNVMCTDISALEYAPKELITADVIFAAITQVPHQADFAQEDYLLGYKTIIECTPAHLWEDKDFTEKFKKEMHSVFTHVNRIDDLNEILSVVDSKTK